MRLEMEKPSEFVEGRDLPLSSLLYAEYFGCF